MPAKKKAEHVFIENTPSREYRMYCTNCGRDYTPALPVSMDMFLAQMKAFIKEHRGCKPKYITTKEHEDHD